MTLFPRDPVLAKLEERLKAALKNVCPQAAVSTEDGRLIARFRTQTFQVHALGRSKGAFVAPHFNPKPYPEDGPDYGGFYLELFTDDNPSQMAAASGGMDLKEPYWTRYLICYTLSRKGQPGFLYMNLKYNEGTNLRTIALLKKVVSESLRGSVGAALALIPGPSPLQGEGSKKGAASSAPTNRSRVL